MALLWVDGFESYGASGAEADISMAGKYLFDAEVNKPDIAAGRLGSTKSMRITTGNTTAFRTPHLTTNRVLIAGAYIYLETTPNNGATFFSFRPPDGDGAALGTYQSFDLQFSTSNSGMEFAVTLAQNVIGATNNCGLTTGNWHHIEFKVYCANSGGTYELRLDGVNVLSSAGTDTQHGGFDYYPMVGLRLNLNGGTINIRFDDFYIMDGTGSAPFNDFLGTGFAVKDIYPVSDVASGNWSITGNTDAYATVNDATENLSSYISANTASKRTMFELTSNSFNTTDNIVGVMISTHGVAQIGCERGVKVVTAQGGGTLNYASAIPFQTDNNSSTECGTAITHIWEKDPNNNSWNSTLVDGLRLGVETS